MAESTWEKLSNEFAGAAEAVGKSVVAVHGRRHASSGIVWRDDSIVTASHAVRRDEDISVIVAGGDRIPARLAGRDHTTDLAVLRLEKEKSAQLAPAKWGDSSQLRIGELVLAVGRTWRGNIVASSGIVSGLMGPWRTWRGGELDQFIRPDLAMYRGFSGGALVNSHGEVLGLNTSGVHRSAITVPASTVAHVAAELLEKGHIERPYLGLAMQAVELQESLRSKLNLNATAGLLVAHVEPQGPADKAGVMLGDVLVELGGKSVCDTDEVQEVLRTQMIGKSLLVTLLRAGRAEKLSITLEARPSR